MTWGMVAVGGATLVGAGLAYQSSQEEGERAEKMNEKSIAFEREKLAEWQETYGGLEDNLAAYYNQLTPEFYEAQGLEAFQKEQQVAQERIKTSLAQRGIEDSGIALALEHQTAQEGAEQRATIRAEAPMKTAEEQRKFLQVGLGLAPGESYSQALSQQASQAQRTADIAEQQSGQAIGQAVSTIGKATADYLNKPAAPTQPSVVGAPVTTTDYSGYA